MTKTKVWYKSKTIWANVIAVTVTALTAVGGYLSATEAVTLLGIINVVLRSVTTSGVSVRS